MSTTYPFHSSEGADRARQPSARKFTWDAAAYAANSAAQLTWARELIGRLQLRGHERVLDVGCGDGKVTADLARAVPHGAALGIDSSPEMIRFATDQFPPSAIPNLTFRVMDAREIRLPRNFDVVFSNAALHWVDDHEAFLRRAAACLHSGGRLLISCGGRGNAQDVFAALRSELRVQRWRGNFRKLERPYFFYDAQSYDSWLPRAGFRPQSVRLVEKDMVFAAVGGLLGWLRTTWLPYTQRVPKASRDEFIAAVGARYLAKHPTDAQGHVHVRMVRLEIDALRV